MGISRGDHRDWDEGPLFNYKPGKVNVNVTGSSWPIRGQKPARGVTDTLREFRRLQTGRVLDFGAGSWLHYVDSIQQLLPSRDVYAVEFDEAFRDDAADVKRRHESDVTFYSPKRFAQRRQDKFDLILLVNVLNTMPEEDHRLQAFAFLSDLLNPLGRLVVYQRIWVESENPSGALTYGEGWLIPQSRYGYFTYGAKTGAKWFNAQAAANKLKPVITKTEISSSNTLLRVWEKPFE